MNIIFAGRSNGKTETIRKMLEEVGIENFNYHDTDIIIYADVETRAKLFELYRRMCNVSKTN